VPSAIPYQPEGAKPMRPIVASIQRTATNAATKYTADQTAIRSSASLSNAQAVGDGRAASSVGRDPTLITRD
jgi:hypothetical protein